MKPIVKPYCASAELDKLILFMAHSPRLRSASDLAKFLRSSEFVGLDDKRAKGRLFLVFRRSTPVPKYMNRYPFIVDTHFDDEGKITYTVLFDFEEFSRIIKILYGV